MARLKHLGCVAFAVSLFAAVSGSVAVEADKPDERVWGEPTLGQVISIATEKPAYEAGERVLLNVRIKNVSTEDVPVFVGPGFPLDYILTLRLVSIGAIDGHYHYRAVAPPDSDVPFTRRGKLEMGSVRGGSSSWGILKPGGERAVEIDLTRLYDMSLAGAYRITAQRQVWKRREADQRAMATSNTLDIIIKDRPYFQRVPRKIETP